MSHSISHAESMDLKHSINLCNHERYPVHLKCLKNIQKIKYPDFQAMTHGFFPPGNSGGKSISLSFDMGTGVEAAAGV